MFHYSYLIAEGKSRFSSSLKPYTSTHDVIDTIEAFHQVSFNYYSMPPIKIKTKPVLFILKRKDNYEDFLPLKYIETTLENEDEELSEETVTKEQEETREIHETDCEVVDENKLDLEITEKRQGYSKIRKNKREIRSLFKVIKRKDEIVAAKKSKTEVKEVQNDYITSDTPINADNRAPETLISESKSETIVESTPKKLNKREKTVEIKVNTEENYLFKPKVSRRKEIEQFENVEIKVNTEENYLFKPKVPRKKEIEQLETTSSSSLVATRIETKEKQNVRVNIKKLIQKYRRQKPNGETATDQRPIHAKDTIKRIIEDEKSKQAEEELTKIQQQIFDIIETNPNIINKKAIKKRLQDTITSELINVNLKEKVFEKQGKAKFLEKESEKIELEQEIDVYKPLTQDEIYHHESKESPRKKMQEETDDEEEDERLLDMSERFMEASQKIADIMIIIDEIVDAMEVTEVSQET